MNFSCIERYYFYKMGANSHEGAKLEKIQISEKQNNNRNKSHRFIQIDNLVCT